MKHVKEKHGNIPCFKFLNKTCRFNESSCIFSHKTSNGAASNASSGPPPTPVDFPQAWQVKAPDQDEQMNRIITNVMKQMMPTMIQQVLDIIENKKQ